MGKKIQQSLFFFSILFFCLLAPSCSGDNSLSEAISIIETFKEVSATSMVVIDKRLYLSTEDGKLYTFDISNPEAPKEKSQVDAFAGKHIGILPFSSKESLLLMGESGKIMAFDIASSPDKPSARWGRGKALQLPVSKLGHYTLRDNISVVYFSPGGGTAVLRLDLTSLHQDNVDNIDANKAIYKVPGGGGGGIYLSINNEGTVTKLYVGNQESGTLDIWDVGKIENQEKDAKPSSQKPLKIGKNITKILPFKEKSNSVDEWLFLVGSGEKDNVEILFLGRHWKEAADPSEAAVLSIKDFFYIDIASKRFLTSELSAYTYNVADANSVITSIQKTSKFAELQQRENLQVNAMVVVENVVFTAEKAGLRGYKLKVPEAITE